MPKTMKKRLGTGLFYLSVTLLAVVTLLPFAWMLSSSFKSAETIRTLPIRWIPEHPSLEGYRQVFQMTSFSFPRAAFNSLFLALMCTAVSVVSASMAAFIFAKVPFKGSGKLFGLFLATMMIPGTVTMVPNYIILRYLHLLDTFTGLILPSLSNAFGVFLMRQFYLGIPNELSEAARIDGLSEYGIWARIVLPLAKPAIATLCIFTFVNTWNDYMGPLIYLTSDLNKTIQVGLRRFIQAYTADYNLIMAASLCSLIPVTIVFLFLQRYFIEGIATTGLKG